MGSHEAIGATFEWSLRGYQAGSTWSADDRRLTRSNPRDTTSDGRSSPFGASGIVDFATGLSIRPVCHPSGEAPVQVSSRSPGVKLAGHCCVDRLSDAG